MKCCTYCNLTKPFEEFSKDSTKKNGIRSTCLQCTRLKAAEYRERNKEVVVARTYQWRQNNKEKARASVQSWREKNRLKDKQVTTKWRKENAAHIRQYNSSLRSGKAKAVPLWFEAEAVANVYKKAQEFGMQVDHVVPLNGKTVCGLHCWANLQLLEQSLNASKSNREWPDMPIPEDLKIISPRISDFS